VTGSRHAEPPAAIAIGVGCRKGCQSGEIVALVSRALAAASCAGLPAGLFTHEAKRDEGGLTDAAKALGIPLRFLDSETLRQAAPRAATASARIMTLYGVPSLSEAAALAGAGPSSVLLLARISSQAASCAIAGTRKAEE